MTAIGILQIIVALGLLNVWLVRSSKSTLYRGGQAKNLKEEFQTYGLPVVFFYGIGFLKITSALALIYGLINPEAAIVGAGLLVFLMLGALGMHIKVKDPIKKSVPALFMLISSLAILYVHTNQ